MKQRKQMLSALLVIAMLGTLLTGCGQKEEEGGEKDNTEVAENDNQEEDDSKEEDSIRISDDVITVTLAGPSGATAMDWNSTLQFAEYEKRLGIKFDATTYTNEQWSSKVTLIMASDEMPDILTMSKDVYKRQVISCSFSNPDVVAAGEIILWPKDFTLDGYKKILAYTDIWIGYGNTVFYTVLGTIVNLVVTLPCAYALSRKDLVGRKSIMVFFMITMYICLLYTSSFSSTPET